MKRGPLYSNWYLIVLTLLPSITYANESYSPYVNRKYPSEVYWGDTHLHTNLSVDAYLGGNRALGPDEAYRFAKGEAIYMHNGMQARLERPLDFLVVADHGENLGVAADLDMASSSLLKTSKGKLLYDELERAQEGSGNKKTIPLSFFGKLFKEPVSDKKYRKSIWERVADNADKHNLPGKFTTFIGYEWTAAWKKAVGSHLHRVLIFKNGKELATQVLPFTSLDSPKPEELWSYMEDYQTATGGEVLAIPHSGNLSAGGLFFSEDSEGKSITSTYATMRARWEPLVEVTQIKGDSETHPILSPTDEFADFETWPGTKYMPSFGKAGDNLREFEYARSGLKLGLLQQYKLGVNPFKFGMIGSTDSHISLSSVSNENFLGPTVANEPSKMRMLAPRLPSLGEDSSQKGWVLNAAGYTAVWAKENTREAIFAAMKRKEVYATTGTRISVRFFGGWDYDNSDVLKNNFVEVGYSKGVPMGGDLTNPPLNKAPTFLIHAAKDPEGANLDRVQVIKGWHNNKGLHERIYNVAWSDGRVENLEGKLEPVGSTVDIEDASYLNSIGSRELAVVWSDPEFSPEELAFYYVRVIEIPTPRWTAYDAKSFDIKNIPQGVPMETQERAYTSPIWYTPSSDIP